MSEAGRSDAEESSKGLIRFLNRVHASLLLADTIEAVVIGLVEDAGYRGASVTIEGGTEGHRWSRYAERGVLEDSGERSITRTVTVGDLAEGSVRLEGAPRERGGLRLDDVIGPITTALAHAVAHERLSIAYDACVLDRDHARAASKRLFENIHQELRSPLTLILLAVSEGRRARSITEEAQKTLAAIEHGTRRLLRMVDELLILAEGREREVRLWFTMCDLSSIVEGTGVAWRPAARAAGLHLDLRVHRGITARIDPNAVERILSNLLSNAVKFTPRGGRVELVLAVHEGFAHIEVRDDGPGLPASIRQGFATRSERGSTVDQGVTAAGGFGLALVKQLAEAHGGHAVPMARRGGGTIVAVKLPIASARMSRPPTFELHLSNLLRPPDYGAPTGPIDNAAKVYEPAETARATILLAESDPDLRDRTAKVLAEEFRVLTACDGAVAFELAKQHSPDLLVTDVAMPNMDGIELTRRFRGLPSHRLAPVLVLTTFHGVRDKLGDFDGGAVDYIHKPFEPEELRARVNSQLTIRRLALQLLETEKLAALGTLSAGLAHEIRNPANGIINAVGPLKTFLPAEAIAPGTPAAQLLDVVEHCSKQVAAISRQLLGFKRNVEPRLQPVGTDALVARVLATTRPSLEGVELREQLEYTGTIHCAEPLLAQVLTNLVQNGAHAAGHGGWVEVRTLLDGPRVVFEVRDSGPGVPDELRERVFEPFFTTKPAGAGTGLGLSTARDIVLRHGGTLDARTSGGRTVFRIEIPLIV